MSPLVDRLRRPEYTGENRCIPCTLVNVGIAVAASVVVGIASPLLGVALFVGSLGAIYFRGYLVPGTPALTKRYLPDRVLAKFDKLPEEGPIAETPSAGADEGGDAVADADLADPEAVLVAASAVEECDDGDDLCLTADFAAAWQAAASDLEDDLTRQREALTSLLDADELVFLSTDRRGQYVASLEHRLATWPTEGALIADLAAHAILDADSEAWAEVIPKQRLGILQAFRSFLDVCPVCGGSVAMTEDTVESCCRSWDVIAVVCGDCEEHYLELDPRTLGATDAGPADRNDRTPVGTGYQR
ncbi:hypothetical protein ACNS7O_05970 [Haloferacaceae archaeon DSL9]